MRIQPKSPEELFKRKDSAQYYTIQFGPLSCQQPIIGLSEAKPPMLHQ